MKPPPPCFPLSYPLACDEPASTAWRRIAPTGPPTSGPCCTPREPLLADLISELETALVGDEPVDGDLRDLFLRLKKRHPDTPWEACRDCPKSLTDGCCMGEIIA